MSQSSIPVRGPQMVSELAKQGITSMYIGWVSFSVLFNKLHFRAMLSEDNRPGEPDDLAKWKFPGGMAKPYEVAQDVAREWFQEAMRPHSMVTLDFAKAQLFYERRRPCEVHRGGTHLKQVFIFDERDLANYRDDRHFRSTPKMEERNDQGHEGGELYPTSPYSVTTLCRQMKLTESYSHREVLVHAVRHLAARQKDVCSFLPGDFLEWVSTDDYKRRN